MSACQICARKGILIYPVRYAIACPAGAAGVPGLSGNFKIENAPAEIGKVKYTLRAMRAGYMYAYDEKRKRLRGYMIMPHGILWNFPIEYLPPPARSVPINPCSNPAELTFGRCIDIVHAAGDMATNLWVGWSNVAWTPALIKKVEDGKWRKNHMQCIDVAAMVAGTAGHTAEFAKHHKEVAHFSLDKAAMTKAFGFSNTPTGFEVNQHVLGDSIAATMAAHAPYNKGFIVALNDPVGITNDLSELTVPSTDAGFDQDIARGKMVYDVLQATEAKIRAGARQDIALDDNIAEAYAASPESGGDIYNGSKTLWKMIKAGGVGKYEEKEKADKKKYGETQAGRMQAEEDHAWEEVISEEEEKTSKTGVKTKERKILLDEVRRKAFPEVYAQAIKQFEPEYNKLVQSHVAWLVSTQLARWMEGVHDATDIRSGYAYSESVLQCVGKAVASKPCSEQLLKWMAGGVSKETSNLYGRALMFQSGRHH